MSRIFPDENTGREKGEAISNPSVRSAQVKAESYIRKYIQHNDLSILSRNIDDSAPELDKNVFNLHSPISTPGKFVA